MTESVLFVCADNSVLSQMAEAFLRRYGWSAFRTYSAGIEPKAVHRYTFHVMEEIGYDLYGYHSKSIFDFNHLEHVDYLITLSDFVKDNFIFHQDAIGNKLHWSFNDPRVEPEQVNKRYIGSRNLFSQDHFDELNTRQCRVLTNKLAKPVIQVPIADNTPKNTKDCLSRFRSLRDEMECQVMNWLDEKGIGPLWWRGETK